MLTRQSWVCWRDSWVCCRNSRGEKTLTESTGATDARRWLAVSNRCPSIDKLLFPSGAVLGIGVGCNQRHGNGKRFEHFGSFVRSKSKPKLWQGEKFCEKQGLEARARSVPFRYLLEPRDNFGMTFARIWWIFFNNINFFSMERKHHQLPVLVVFFFSLSKERRW